MNNKEKIINYIRDNFILNDIICINLLYEIYDKVNLNEFIEILNNSRIDINKEELKDLEVTL